MRFYLPTYRSVGIIILSAVGGDGMEKCSTKREILKTALDMFSQQGYEATSVSQIADAVGIRKASVYSHFGSKQEILDELVKIGLEEYGRHSVFARADWDDPAFTKEMQSITFEEVLQMIL